MLVVLKRLILFCKEHTKLVRKKQTTEFLHGNVLFRIYF